MWLASRQARHVTRHRARVPDEFAEKIGLQSHQRAADYTVERMKLSVTRRVFDAMVLIAFTLLGGLQMINGFLISIIPNDFWRQILLLGSVLLISGALQLPFSLWKQFRLEQKFGFNRMTLGLFVSDTIKGLLVSVVLGLPLAAVTLWLMAASGPLWWLWAWMVWVAFNAFILFVFPTWIARFSINLRHWTIPNWPIASTIWRCAATLPSRGYLSWTAPSAQPMAMPISPGLANHAGLFFRYPAGQTEP